MSYVEKIKIIIIIKYQNEKKDDVNGIRLKSHR